MFRVHIKSNGVWQKFDAFVDKNTAIKTCKEYRKIFGNKYKYKVVEELFEEHPNPFLDSTIGEKISTTKRKELV